MMQIITELTDFAHNCIRFHMKLQALAFASVLYYNHNRGS